MNCSDLLWLALANSIGTFYHISTQHFYSIMMLLVESLICLSYIYETYKYTFLETVAAAKHRL